MELSYSGKSESRAYGSCVCFKRGVSKLASDTPSFLIITTLKPLKSQSQREIGAIDILHTLSRKISESVSHTYRRHKTVLLGVSKPMNANIIGGVLEVGASNGCRNKRTQLEIAKLVVLLRKKNVA